MTIVRRLARDASGSAAAELAMVLPAIAFVILNVVDLGVYTYTRMQVDLAAQEAVGYARVTCSDPAKLPALANSGTKCKSTLIADMQTAAQSTSLGATVTIANTAEGYYCADAAGELQASTAAATSCTATVAGSTSTPGIYLRTTATKSFSAVFPGASIASALPATISRTAWIRLK